MIWRCTIDGYRRSSAVSNTGRGYPMLNDEQAWVFTGCLLIVTLLLLAWNSRWHLLQGVIFMAVVASNIHWKWTDNPTVACLIGAACAYVASALLTKALIHAQRHRYLR